MMWCQPRDTVEEEHFTSSDFLGAVVAFIVNFRIKRVVAASQMFLHFIALKQTASLTVCLFWEWSTVWKRKRWQGEIICWNMLHGAVGPQRSGAWAFSLSLYWKLRYKSSHLPPLSLSGCPLIRVCRPRWQLIKGKCPKIPKSCMHCTCSNKHSISSELLSISRRTTAPLKALKHRDPSCLPSQKVSTPPHLF